MGLSEEVERISLRGILLFGGETMRDSQDLAGQIVNQIADIAKKIGRTARAVGKAAKWMKKFGFLKVLVVSILKVVSLKAIAIGAVIVIALFLLLAVLESIPGSDWFLGGNSRSEAQVAVDNQYEQSFRDLADQSVAEIDDIEADQEWKTNFKNLVKPSWGIPAALGKYEIVKANQRIELPDPAEMIRELEPVFTYKIISDDVRYFRHTDRCRHTYSYTDAAGNPQTGSYTTTDVSYSQEPMPDVEVLDKVINPYGETTVPSLKRYYPGGHDDGFQSGWEYYDTSSSGNCTRTTFTQWEKTGVDDRGLPMLNIEPAKLKGILMSKGIPEKDIPVILEFASLSDDNFYAEQFDGSVKSGRYSGATYEYDGEIIDGWVWPVAENRTITSSFGGRWGSFHYGVDLGGRAADGYPILAAKDGLVILSQWSDSYGNWVIIAHDDGLQTRYAHMSSAAVEVNEQVVAGQQVGTLGTTGRSTGPHLHFEVLRPGKVSPLAKSNKMETQYDPMIFLSRLLD